MKVYGYIRVSTQSQHTENQKIEIEKYCANHNISSIEFISEKISGTKSYKKRKLGNLLNTLEKDDVLIVTELSRLGRSLMMIFDVLNQLLTKGVKVYAIKENYELGDNIQSQVLTFAFGLSAQIERDLLSERVKMGQQRALKEGKYIGRRKGVSYGHKLDGKIKLIRSLLKTNNSFTEIAKELNVSRPTLQHFCDEHHIKYRNRKIKHS